jgi:hypothetical protein
MASAEYIAAAKKENRKQTTLLSIEDVDATTTFYTTKSDWDGSTTLTNIDTDIENGSAIPNENLTYTPESPITTPGGTTAYSRAKSSAIPFDIYPYNIKGIRHYTFRAGVGLPSSYTAAVRLDIYDAATGGNFICSTETKNVNMVVFEIQPVAPPNEIRYYRCDFNDFEIDTTGKVASTVSNIYARPIVTDGFGIDTASANGDNVPEDTVNANLTTSTIDLGAVPSSNPTLNIDDVEPSGSAITYTAVGGNADPPTTSLGTVEDGDSLTAYRYYRITANFASTGGRGELRELSLTEGLFRYYGTHQDSPFQGIKPYIVEGSVSSLKTKIDLNKGISTTGEVSVKLLWTPDTADLVSTGYLKGKDVVLSAGFVGLDTESYEPVITGSIQDVELDANNSTVTLKIQSVLKQFEKRKLPEVTYDATGANTGTDITYTTTSLITAILDIYDKIGLRDRYVPDDYATLEAGDYAANKYKVSRTLSKSKPIEAFKLLDELAQTGGLFLVPLGNGQIRPKVYNRNEAVDVTLDATEMKYSKIDLLYKDFYSRFLAYYNPDTTDFPYNDGTKVPSKAEDYDNAKFLFDATAETLFSPEKGQKDWFDKWLVGRTTASTALTTPPTALTDLVDRWNGWYSDPLFTFTTKDLPPRLADIDAGDIVGVDNLPLPAPADDYASGTTYGKGDRVGYQGVVYQSLQDSNTGNTPNTSQSYWVEIGISYEDRQTGRYGFSDGMRWLVMSKTFNPNTATIDLTFLQMPYAELGAFSSDEFSTAFDTTGE